LARRTFTSSLKEETMIVARRFGALPGVGPAFPAGAVVPKVVSSAAFRAVNPAIRAAATFSPTTGATTDVPAGISATTDVPGGLVDVPGITVIDGAPELLRQQEAAAAARRLEVEHVAAQQEARRRNWRIGLGIAGAVLVVGGGVWLLNR
jgi:hypothetical protein